MEVAKIQILDAPPRPPVDGMDLSAVGTGVGSSAQWFRALTPYQRPGLASRWCALEGVGDYLVFYLLRSSGSLQSLFSKFLVGPWCLVLFIIHTWEVREEWRGRERSSSLEKVRRRAFRGEVIFALYPERHGSCRLGRFKGTEVLGVWSEAERRQCSCG